MSSQEQNIRYWTDFCDYLRQRGSQLQPQISREKYYIDFRIGIPGYSLRTMKVINPRDGHPPGIRVRFVMSGRAGTSFHELREQQKEIEEEFGEPLEWRAREKEKLVTLRKEADPCDQNDWPNQHTWLASKLEKLNEVFRPRIMALNAAGSEPLEDKDEAYNKGESFIEEQAEYVTSQSKSNMPMHAYVVMLHLVSQRYSDFTEIRKVLCRESVGTYYITILDDIVKKIGSLEEAWGETIPPITALVFNTDGRASKWTCEILTGDGDVQPTAYQVAKLAASVAAYDKWDEVLKALKP